MTKFNVYANGSFFDQIEADTAEDAIQACADEHGTVDVGETLANTDGMTAEEAVAATGQPDVMTSAEFNESYNGPRFTS